MARLFLLISLLMSFGVICNGQTQNKHAPKGFDVFQENNSHRKIDTINYPPKTVGLTRSARILQKGEVSDSVPCLVRDILAGSFFTLWGPMKMFLHVLR